MHYHFYPAKGFSWFKVNLEQVANRSFEYIKLAFNIDFYRRLLDLSTRAATIECFKQDWEYYSKVLWRDLINSIGYESVSADEYEILRIIRNLSFKKEGFVEGKTQEHFNFEVYKLFKELSTKTKSRKERFKKLERFLLEIPKIYFKNLSNS